MSTTALFRQLTAGITFDTKRFVLILLTMYYHLSSISTFPRFKAESTKFGLVKKEEDVKEDKEVVELPDIKKVTLEVTEKLAKDEERAKALAGGEDSDNDITVIGKIKTTQKKKKSKSKITKAKIREVYTEQLNRFRNSHNIHVTGTDVEEPIDSWSVLYTTSWNLPRPLDFIITPRVSACIAALPLPPRTFI